MKDNDEVKLIAEKKEGVHKGAQGTICDPRNIYGQWLVDFRKEDGVHALACIPVDEIWKLHGRRPNTRWA